MSIKEELLKLKSALRPLRFYNLGENTVLNSELSSYAAGFNILNENLKTLEREAFVVTAESFGLENRERISGNLKTSSTVEQRRLMLIYEMSITANDFNRAGIEKSLAAVGLDCEVVENIDDQTLYLNCFEILDGRLTEDEVKKYAEKFLPAHLDVVFDFRKLDWDNIDSRSLSFDEMDNKLLTWDEIDVYTD